MRIKNIKLVNSLSFNRFTSKHVYLISRKESLQFLLSLHLFIAPDVKCLIHSFLLSLKSLLCSNVLSTHVQYSKYRVSNKKQRSLSDTSYPALPSLYISFSKSGNFSLPISVILGLGFLTRYVLINLFPSVHSISFIIHWLVISITSCFLTHHHIQYNPVISKSISIYLQCFLNPPALPNPLMYFIPPAHQNP